MATLSLNTNNNKYCCSRCGAGGFSIGLYARVRCIDTKRAYKELLEKESFSMDRTNVIVNTTNELADIEKRDAVYREFLSMLKLELKHKNYLEQQGLLQNSIESQMYRSIPNKYIKKLLMANSLKRKFDLSGIPGFYQQEDWNWNFVSPKGFFIPVFNNKNQIQGLSIHLDNPYNESSDIWFSSSEKLNGTSMKSCVIQSNVCTKMKTVVLTDNLILGNLIKSILDVPIIAFSNISSSYQIIKILEGTNIKNIIFILRINENNSLDYVIDRILSDLQRLGYNINIKTIREYKDILEEDSLYSFSLEQVA